MWLPGREKLNRLFIPKEYLQNFEVRKFSEWFIWYKRNFVVLQTSEKQQQKQPTQHHHN